MATLCYFHIIDYKSVQNIGISLDSRFYYTVDVRQKLIKIHRNTNYIEGFLPKSITSLSAIVGNNGAGKTTCLLYMLNTLAQGGYEKSPQAIIIYRNSLGLNVYLPPNCGYHVDTTDSIQCKETSVYPFMELFYYSAYFRPCISIHEPGDGEVDGIYNASDTWRLIKDYQDYANVDTLQQSEGIRFHMDALRAQDNNRIVQMICDKELRAMLPKDAIPRYIIIEPNKSGYQRLLSLLGSENNEAHPYIPQFEVSKDGNLASIVATNLYNIGVELSASYNKIEDDVRRWENIYREKKDVVSAMAKFLEEPSIAVSQLLELQRIVKFLYDVCYYREATNALFLDSTGRKNVENVGKLRQFYMDKSFVVAHFFDLCYSHVPATTTRLSSGEFDMLKFFSRLYDSVCIRPERFDSIKSPLLILIDEAENSYHPEWQRKYINLLVKFIDALYNRKKGTAPFQIVLTTHSPILLSDIPRDCINYLEKLPKSGKVRLSPSQPETFGTNVFELYRYAFFMSDGLVGEFASEKIQRLRDDILSGKKSYRELRRRVEIIGDEKIKEYLFSMLEIDNRQMMIEYYENKLNELKGRKKHAADKH